MKTNLISRYAPIILFIIVTVVAFFVIRPYITALLAAMILAYVLYPLYSLILKGVKNKNLASLIMCVLVVLIIFIPFFFVLNSLIAELRFAYADFTRYVTVDYLNIPNLESMLQGRLGIPIDMTSIVSNTLDFLVSHAKSTVSSVPDQVLGFFIMIFTMFFLFKEGDRQLSRFFNIVALKHSLRKRILDRVTKVTNAIIYGYVVTALIQGAVGGIGFLIFGVKSPVLWGLLMAFFALIPMVGPPIIYVPVSAYLIATGLINGAMATFGRGIGLLAFGVLVISTIDNFLRPQLIGSQARIHPVIVLLGVLGGLSLMGLIGIVIGPLSLALFITIIKELEHMEIGEKNDQA